MTGQQTSPPPVRIHIADAVVARLAAARARQVPGVVALRAGLATAPLGSPLPGEFGRSAVEGVRATVGEGSAEVSVAVVTRLGYNCRDLAQAVQREVAGEVAAGTGLDTTVTVLVADIVLD